MPKHMGTEQQEENIESMRGMSENGADRKKYYRDRRRHAVPTEGSQHNY